MTDRHEFARGSGQSSSRIEGAAGRLLERELPAGYREEWTRHLANQTTLNATELRSCVVFRIGEAFLALPTSLVDVVAEDSAFHTIPARRSGMPVTLANVRGELVICVSLAAFLGLETKEATAPSERKHYPHLISCRRDSQRFAFPVDEICGVEQYPVDKTSDIPATLAGSTNNYTRGLISIGGRTIGLVNEDLLFDAWGRSLL
jgi:chemotaxis-related protein WspD